MSDLIINLEKVRGQIQSACLQYQRSPEAVNLLAVSKTFPACDVECLYTQGGQIHFGENYVQEAIQKIQTLSAYRSQLVWHFIGPLQSNKTRVVAEHFDWVHSIDRLKIAQRLSEQRPVNMPALRVFLQINISEESTKSGMRVNDLDQLVPAVQALPRLSLEGLMAIPAPGDEQRAFKAMKALACEYNLPHLSMGMSADLECAIAQGATFVRIGTAIFGQR